MIISHSKKFCYWKIARTGSNTAELCIRMSGILDLSQDVVTSCHFFPSEHNVHGPLAQSGHTLPADAIAIGALTQEQYDTYDHYTIVRNPLDRWISAYAFRCRRGRAVELTTEQMFKDRVDDAVAIPQSEYLALGRVQTFPFSDYETSIKKIISAIGGRLEDVPNLKHMTSKWWTIQAKREVYSPSELRTALLLRYKPDMELDY